ncbi:MAG: OmpW family protein [Xanthomonadales bacterium]|nr:outer membrane beta-barrel protein [Gammaproteobacteria bacterium]MBT8072159.1 outer membrane beta-barrel protein [Gammaproteobacteria bacterium]NNK02999.1 OmpW family protein [Xanthomonadales bacterium]
MRTKMKIALSAAIAMGLGLANTATAFEPGDWLVRAGASYVNPASDNSDIVSVEPGTSFTINLTYMMTDVWAIEVLAAYPFKHDIELLDGTKVGSTKHLPPTVSLQYHFRPTEQFQPYVGIGLNYTTFSSEKTTGPLEGTDLKLGDSWGLGGEIGFDMMFNDDWFFNANVRYLDIDTKARLDGASLGKVNIDPWVFGGHIGFRF